MFFILQYIVILILNFWQSLFHIYFTVTPYNRFTGEGNGFSFANYDAWELRDAIRLALSCWNDKDVMRGLIDHAMKADFGFEISAQEYAKLYIWML